jgi:thiosulfate/3-mercaptopyruvate sulfurtransferase
LFIPCKSSAPVAAITGDVPVLVSCQWLEENSLNQDLVILHISSIIRDYNNGHIPGAEFLWPGWISISTEKETTVPAGIRGIKRVLEGLGISNKSHIVLCGFNGNLAVVCRIFVTLGDIGLAGRVSILEGGFDEWKASGMRISVESSEIRKGKLKTTRSGNFVDGSWMSVNLTNNAYSIIDSRSIAYYQGSTAIGRPGHIPGAKNMPATDLYNTKSFHFVATEKIKELFEKLEIPVGVKPIFYCFNGTSACINYVAAIIAGYSPLIYDGSMEDWASRLDMPMETN